MSEARRAVTLASSAPDSALAEQISRRLRLYERKEPYREPPEANTGH
jgi:hypothetical protein